MSLFDYNRTAKKILGYFNAQGPTSPSPRDDFIAPFHSPWNARSLIIPLPESDGLSLFSCSLFLGRMGIENMDDGKTDVNFTTEGHFTVLAYDPKNPATLGLEFSSASGIQSDFTGFNIHSTFEYQVVGPWPEYQVKLHVPELELEAKFNTINRPPVDWWLYSMGLFNYHTSIGHSKGFITLKGKTTQVNHPTHLKVGRGHNLLTMPLSIRPTMSYLHFELGTIPQIGNFSLGCFRFLQGKLEPVQKGVFIDEKGHRFPIDEWSITGTSSVELPDKCGGFVHVPENYVVQALGKGIEMTYRAKQIGHPVVGMGRLSCSGSMLDVEISLEGRKTRKGNGIVFQQHVHDSELDVYG